MHATGLPYCCPCSVPPRQLPPPLFPSPPPPQNQEYRGMSCMGVAGVGASACAGWSAVDVQRAKMIVSGLGPDVHPFGPLQPSLGLNLDLEQEPDTDSPAPAAAGAEESPGRPGGVQPSALESESGGAGRSMDQMVFELPTFSGHVPVSQAGCSRQ